MKKGTIVILILCVLLVLASVGTYFWGYSVGKKAGEESGSPERSEGAESVAEESGGSAEPDESGVSETSGEESEGGSEDESGEEPFVIDYRAFTENVDYGDQVTYVVGHKNPDLDTVAASIAYANLLTQMGVRAEARLTGEIDSETEFALDHFSLKLPELLTDASGLQLALVDHNARTQTVDGADDARIVAVIDHHNLSDVSTVDIVPTVILPVGSTCTILYTMFTQLGLTIPRPIAGLMAAAIMSDTNNCRYQDATAMDEAAVEALLKRARTDRGEFNLKRLEARVDYGDMTDREILFDDYKTYAIAGYAVGVGCVVSVGEEGHRDMISRMQTEMEKSFADSGMDLMYILIHDYESGRQDILYFGDGAKEAVIEAFGSEDGEHIILNPSISRKSVFIPGLTRVLEKNPKKS